jgi:hypothetical protein
MFIGIFSIWLLKSACANIWTWTAVSYNKQTNEQYKCIVLWRVIPLLTPNVTCLGTETRSSDCWLILLQSYTSWLQSLITLLHSYTANNQYTLIFPFCSEDLGFTWKLLTANCLSRSSCLQDNPSARTPRKTVALLLRVCLSSRCIAMVTARTHGKPVT